jgi:hypothetical protein
MQQSQSAIAALRIARARHRAALHWHADALYREVHRRRYRVLPVLEYRRGRESDIDPGPIPPSAHGIPQYQDRTGLYCRWRMSDTIRSDNVARKIWFITWPNDDDISDFMRHRGGFTDEALWVYYCRQRSTILAIQHRYAVLGESIRSLLAADESIHACDSRTSLDPSTVPWLTVDPLTPLSIAPEFYVASSARIKGNADSAADA